MADKITFSAQKLTGVVIALLLASVVYFLLPESCPEAAKRTAFVFVIAGLFWALELIPLYATSVVIVLFLILMLCKPGGVLGMDEGGYTIFLVPFSSPVIILFFGGFILAQAMQKYQIDRQVASRLLKWFGQRPYGILIGFMATTAFLSMWLSNTATTAMMIAMIIPLLASLDRETMLFEKHWPLVLPLAPISAGSAHRWGRPQTPLRSESLQNTESF